MRPEHFGKLVRRVEGNEHITRLFVLDHMVDLVTEYIGIDEAEKVQKLYMDWTLGKGGNYNEFKKMFTDIISKAKDLPEGVKWRFSTYLDFLFPPPMPT